MTALEDELGILLGSRDLADTLLARTTLRHLAESPVEELARLVPRRAAERLHAAFRVGREAVSPTQPRILTSARDVFRHLHPYLAARETERMVVVACDVLGRPLATQVIAEGGPADVSVRIADLFTAAIRHRAVAIAMAHNHPSGSLDPSPQDLALTRQAVRASGVLDVYLIDHLIVTGRGFTSLRQRAPGLFVEILDAERIGSSVP